MQNPKKSIRFIVTIGLLMTSQMLFSSDLEKKELKKCSRLQLGVIRTAHSFNDSYSINSGLSLHHNYCIIPGENVGYGAGIGVVSYPNETFLPIYIDILTGHSKKYFFNFQIGYSIGWKKSSNYFKGFEFGGGVYGSAGAGYKISLSTDYSVYFQSMYRFQMSELREEKAYKGRVYYNGVEISIGIIFHK